MRWKARMPGTIVCLRWLGARLTFEWSEVHFDDDFFVHVGQKPHPRMRMAKRWCSIMLGKEWRSLDEAPEERTMKLFAFIFIHNRKARMCNRV